MGKKVNDTRLSDEGFTLGEELNKISEYFAFALSSKMAHLPADDKLRLIVMTIGCILRVCRDELKYDVSFDLSVLAPIVGTTIFSMSNSDLMLMTGLFNHDGAKNNMDHFQEQVMFYIFQSPLVDGSYPWDHK